MYRAEIDVVDIDGIDGVFIHLPEAEHVDGVPLDEWYADLAATIAEAFIEDKEWSVRLNGHLEPA